MNKKEVYRKAIFAVIYKFDKNHQPIYLLLKRKSHWRGWEFTKGGIEKNESEISTVKREVKEESGLKIKKIINHHYKGKYLYKKTIATRPYKGQSYNLYSTEVFPGKVKIDKHEHEYYQWLPINKAIKKLTWSNQKKCLKIVNKSLEK